MKNIMTRAWEIARDGQNKFGGKVSEYLSQALKMAWADNSVTKVSWENANGIEIEMSVEHVTERVVGVNEFTNEKITKNVDEMEVTQLVIGGEEVSTWNTRRVNGKLATGRVTFRGKKTTITIDLPKEINQKVWGKFDARQNKKQAIINQVNNERSNTQKAMDILACGA